MIRRLPYLRHAILPSLLLAGLAGACSEKVRPDTLSDQPKTTPTDTSTDTPADEPTDISEIDPLAPDVTVVAPASDGIVSGDFSFECVASKSEESGANDVDPNSVYAELLDSEGELIEVVEATADAKGSFSGSFTLGDEMPSDITLRCFATDDTTPDGLLGFGEVELFYDTGPSIVTVKPPEGSSRPVSSAVRFEYQVVANELFEDDSEAAVVPSSVTMEVRGVEFALEQSSTDASVYYVDVDFQDTSLFPELPTGELFVVVTASNDRDEDPVTVEHTHSFKLDGEGPAVTIVSPTDGALIGGLVTLTLNLSDALSGVDLDTLVITLNNEEHEYSSTNDRWSLSGDTVTFQFESAEVLGTVRENLVTVRVTDQAGNPSPGAASVTYLRDDAAPIFSLDPPNIRMVVTGDPAYCSHAFDPVGDAAAGQGDDVLDVVQFRALIVDQGNYVSGAPLIHYADVDNSTVELWVAEGDEALVIDTNDDGICDDVTTEENLHTELSPLAPGGSAYYGDNSEETEAPAMGDLCDPRGDIDPPERLCDGFSDLTKIAHRTSHRDTAVVYAVSPADGLECAGRGWEVRGALEDTSYQGWVCAAVRGADNVGNKSVSKPIAVCLNNDNAIGLPSCWDDAETPPSCSDGCTPRTFPADGFMWVD